MFLTADFPFCLCLKKEEIWIEFFFGGVEGYILLIIYLYSELFFWILFPQWINFV